MWQVCNTVHSLILRSSVCTMISFDGLNLFYLRKLMFQRPKFIRSSNVIRFGCTVKTKLKLVMIKSTHSSLDMILSNTCKRITEALIRLCVGADWSAPLLFANPRRQGFSRRAPLINKDQGIHCSKIYSNCP